MKYYQFIHLLLDKFENRETYKINFVYGDNTDTRDLKLVEIEFNDDSKTIDIIFAANE